MSEELLQQLIHMVAENNRLVKETQQELREFKKEMYDFRDEMYVFRDDTTLRLDRLERQNKHIDADLDLLHRKVSDQERELNRVKQVGQ
ncbi:hypothetical protein [Brevibacillus fortis]|uniref:Uncharacterized protein n=2 Tax=Brevibacillus fortis TaxID=2126352 RepID=A0A2P7UL27_9BACL|nr:hypothetical protein [Brevibacillus fortis]PSJ87667.1 hypothetical protein C7R93_26535 [Brevibacillus fortis]